MTSNWKTPKPERFGFYLQFSDLRDAVDFVRMTGEGETIDVTLGPQFLTLARERNGINCSADIPMSWESTPWAEQGLLFQTKITLFDRLLRRDIEWSEVLITGSYPGAAINENETEKNTAWRIRVRGAPNTEPSTRRAEDTAKRSAKITESIELIWPMTFLRSAEPARPPGVDGQVVQGRSLAQTMRLLAQVAAPEKARRGVYAAATLGEKQARLAGRAVRVVKSDALQCERINIQCKHLSDVASLLDRIPTNTPRMVIKDGQVTFVATHAHFTFAAAAELPFDMSELEGRPPLAEAEFVTSQLSLAIDKISSQAREKDETVWWRMSGDVCRDVQLVVDVPGGAAVVTFLMTEGQHEVIPEMNYRFTVHSLAALTPLGRSKTTTLAFSPHILMSRQVEDELVVTTYIQAVRATANK